MRNRLASAALMAAAVVVAGCIETEQTYILNPDGSGKVVVESKFQPGPNIDLGGGKPDPKSQMKKTVLEILKQSEGVTVWKDVSYSLLDDGRTRFVGTAYFKDIRQLELHNMQMFKFAWSTSGGKGVLALRSEEKGKHKQEMTEAEIQAAIARQRAEFNRNKPLMTAFVVQLKAEATVRLPGAVTEKSNFAPGTDAQTLTIGFTGAKMLAAMDVLLKDDAAMRKIVMAGEKVGEGKASQTDEANEVLFGQKGPVRAVATGMKPQFDYATEVAQARKGYRAMLKKLGLEEKVALPPDKGEGLKSVAVGGVRVVWTKGADQKTRPFNWSVGYTLALTGEFGGAVLDVEKGELVAAVADTGENLLPTKQWDRKISFPRLSEDGKTVAFEIKLNLPGENVKAIKEVSGVLEYTTAAGTKEVDLGITDFKAGAKGDKYGAVIESIGKSQWGDGVELKLSMNQAPKAYKEVILYDASGAPLKIKGTGSMRSGNQLTLELQRERAFPAKGRIVIGIHEGLKRFEAPFKVTNISLLGRPLK